MKRSFLQFLVLIFLFCNEAQAQDFGQQLVAGAKRAADLQFPSGPKTPSTFSSNEMAIYKPDGDGPFPALVLLHTCGGIREEIRNWAKRSVENGYVAFVVDSLSQRGLKSNCYPPTSVYPSRGARDAFQALAHLQTFPFVDKTRIGYMGWSFGGTVGLLLSSSEASNALATDSGRFASGVSFYPLCNFKGMPSAPTPFEYLRPSTDRPLLVLMGENDNETPPSECMPRLERLIASRAPVESYLYPETTHCWDCQSVSNLVKTDFMGNKVVYRYDKTVTEDSAKRALEFLARTMALRGKP